MPNSFPLPANVLPVEELHDLLYIPASWISPASGIKALAIDQKDLILIAKTGWGKSMIFQSIPALRKGGIALILMPLNLLEEDQVCNVPLARVGRRAVDTYSYCKCWLIILIHIRQNQSARYLGVSHVFLMVKQIPAIFARGSWTGSLPIVINHCLHLFGWNLSLTILVRMGPETALSDKFAEILEHKEFQRRLVLVAIDEVHLVQKWEENWREHYSQIEVLRHWIDERVPWFATSATLKWHGHA